MSKPIEKKSNSLKPLTTKKHKEAYLARMTRRKKNNPNLNTWRIGLKGRLRRLKLASTTASGDHLKSIQARIDEIIKMFREHGQSV